MLSKLFDARQKLQKLSIDNFQAYLAKNALTKEDYLNLMREVFTNKREMFIKYLKLLTSYEKCILASNLKDLPLFLELCKQGTVSEVEGLCKLINYKVEDYCSQNPLYYCLQNENRSNKNEKSDAILISKYLISINRDLMNWKITKSLMVEALEKRQLQCCILFIKNGVDCSAVNENDENILHLLFKQCNKKNEKQILELRMLMIQKGVNQQKINRTGRKPIDFCPELQKKIYQEDSKKRNHKLPIQEIPKVKGKSEEGWEQVQKNKAEKGIASGHEGNRNILVKIDNKYDQNQLQFEADNILQSFTQEKEHELKKKKIEKDREKTKSKKRVLTPDELKYYLDQDIIYETDIIQSENKKLNGFFNQLIEKITKEIVERYNVDIEVFGSFATGLCLPESDIDMVIVSREDSNPFSLLHDIHTHLETMKEEIQNSKFIKTASVPIIKIQCTKQYYEKKIDITFQDGNHNGRESVKLIKKYLEIYPQLRALTIILKQFIYSAQLSDPYSGGISSYGLIIMIVGYIQNDNRQRKAMGNNNYATPAQLLIGFLKYYGFRCNYIGKKICALEPEQAEQEMRWHCIDQNPEPIFMTMEMELFYNNEWQLRPRLIIIDPLNENNNIGRATHKIKEIRNAFQMAYVSIHTNKQCGNKKKCESYKNIKQKSEIDVRYASNKQPCCIIKRMLQAANIISIP